uniref:Uncharacterized protein n=1 Tax=Aegilops tauschii subsp. strangulata TaxID=200361 RepID=A0A453MTW0_AEGTS
PYSLSRSSKTRGILGIITFHIGTGVFLARSNRAKADDATQARSNYCCRCLTPKGNFLGALATRPISARPIGNSPGSIAEIVAILILPAPWIAVLISMLSQCGSYNMYTLKQKFRVFG